MKTMCLPGYHCNAFVATVHQVSKFPQSHCGENREGTLFS